MVQVGGASIRAHGGLQNPARNENPRTNQSAPATYCAKVAQIIEISSSDAVHPVPVPLRSQNHTASCLNFQLLPPRAPWI